MIKEDIFVILCLIVTVVSAFLTAFGTLEKDYGIAIIGIFIAFLVYSMSLKTDKSSMRIISALLDERKRKILECLEIERTPEEIIAYLQKNGVERTNALDLIHSLEKRRFIHKTNGKYSRNF